MRLTSTHRTLPLLVLLVLLVAALLLPDAATAGKPKISKDEVWSTYEYRDSEKYLSHNTCGEPTKEGAWEGEVYVNYTRICVKLTIRKHCTCRKFDTTYRKMEGNKKYQYWSIGESEEVPCTDKLPAAEQAACQKEAAEAETCGKLPFADGGSESFRVECPAGVVVKDHSPLNTMICSKCKSTSTCNDNELVAKWAPTCEAVKNDEACAKLTPTTYGFGSHTRLSCPAGMTSKDEVTATKGHCQKCTAPACNSADDLDTWKRFCANPGGFRQ